ncbi:MAG: chloramphenicol acetyltransferase [Prevotella sp.]|nr:chloramphenicol acetyltransferase [Prevotella sp.]
MKQEINPKDTNRAQAFELWMKSPVPMVTLTKTFDVTHIYKICKRKNLKFNMLLCWCMGRVASRKEEFYLLPENGKLYKFDRLAINVIVNNKEGGISLCDVPYSDDFEQFKADYLSITQAAIDTCESTSDEEAMILGTSAVTGTELDCIVNQYSGIYNNPFLAWGRYRKGWFSVKLPISFQFHHVQMDGGHAASFLEELQNTFNTLKP